MENLEIKSLLKDNLESLIKAGKDTSRSGEELKAITEAIGINISLLESFDFVPCDSNGYHSTKDTPLTNLSTKN